MQKLDLLYKGKAKSVFETDNPDYLILESVSYTHLTLPTIYSV